MFEWKDQWELLIIVFKKEFTLNVNVTKNNLKKDESVLTEMKIFWG